jgi:putative ATP-binding cassette transporter
LLWDGQLVDAQHRDAYRQLWSAVFSDLYLFERLYGLDPTGLQARATHLLDKLGLAGVVSVQDGAFSSLDVSQGQRKRLGLFVALLEDRPLYLFDEWAADQDPEWKHIFYRELLPELRAQGKGVVVITHDDRYFDAADRVLVLHDGQLDG